MRMLSHSFFELGEKSFIGRFARAETLLIENINNTTISFLHQVADYLVVEIFRRFPLDI